jgi:hypothetical protein
MSVRLIGMHLVGVDLVGVYFIDVDLGRGSHRHASHRRASHRMYFIGVYGHVPYECVSNRHASHGCALPTGELWIISLTICVRSYPAREFA